MPNRIKRISILVLAVILGASTGSAIGKMQPTTAPTTSPTQVNVDPKADQVLREMCDVLRNAESFSANMQSITKVSSAGMRQETFSTQSIAVERPNKIAIETKEGMGGTLISDGKQLLVHFPMMGKYAIEDAPQSLEKLSTGPAAGILGSAGIGATGLVTVLGDDPYAKAMESVEKLEYVELRTLEDGTECHVLRFIQPGMNLDLWVQAAPQPRLPRRIVPDLSGQFAQMQQEMPGMKDMKIEMTSDVSDWKIDFKLPKDRFAIVPPPEAKQVDSVSEIFGMGAGGGEDEHPILGQSAPPFKLGLLDGGNASLSEHNGKDIVVLDFWATWCGPCVQALPILAETVQAYQDQRQPIAFYAVNQSEQPDVIKQFLAKKKLDIMVALDSDGKVGELYGVTGIPQTVVIDTNGIVQSVHVGFDPNLKEELSKELETLLAGGSLLKSPTTIPNESEEAD